MKIGCVISIVLLIVGTMLEVVGSINNRNVFKANKYLAINIWFYSLFFGMICIFLDLPYMWAYISHILVAIIICSIALFRNNNCKKQIEKSI